MMIKSMKMRARKKEIESFRKFGICVLISPDSPINLEKIYVGDTVTFISRDREIEISAIAFIKDSVPIKKKLGKGKNYVITYIVFKLLDL